MTELATSTHAALADRYFDRLAFGWQRRSSAEQSHVIDFAELCEWDQSLEACKQGLDLCTKASLQVIQTRLEEPLSRGEFFAVALHAISTQNAQLQASCIAMMQAMSHLRDVYPHVIAWSDMRSTVWGLEQLAQPREGATSSASESLQTMVTVSACQIHPELRARDGYAAWMTGAISACLHSPTEPASDARAIALLELAATSASTEPSAIDLADAMLTSPLAALRGLAAEVLLGLPKKLTTDATEQRALDTLLALVNAQAPDDSRRAKHRAVQALALWCLPDFDSVLVSVSKQPEQLDLYLRALSWSGGASAIPILMAYLEHPVHQRLAGASLSLLTGSLPALDGWQAESNEAPAAKPHSQGETEAFTDAITPNKPYADLPAPSLIGFTRWWAENRKHFNPSSTWLAGLPASRTNFLHILEHGKCAWRSLAARRLCTMSSGSHLNISAPAYRQRQWLAEAARTST